MRSLAKPTEQWSNLPIILLTSWSELPPPPSLSLECTRGGLTRAFSFFSLFTSPYLWCFHFKETHPCEVAMQLLQRKWLHCPSTPSFFGCFPSVFFFLFLFFLLTHTPQVHNSRRCAMVWENLVASYRGWTRGRLSRNCQTYFLLWRFYEVHKRQFISNEKIYLEFDLTFVKYFIEKNAKIHDNSVCFEQEFSLITKPR